jgi:succinate-acetate transporter protein
MLRPGNDKGIATPIPLGLAALGTTTFLMGLAIILQWTASSPPYVAQALVFGGLVLLLAGMWAFAYGDALAATTFSFLGAFFGWWGLAYISQVGVHAGAAVWINSLATVYIVSGVVTLYLWIASFYEFAAFNLVLLFLWIAFGLIGIGMYSNVWVVSLLGGIAALVSGVISGYASFAAIYNAASLEDMIPLGEFNEVKQRVEQDERERIRRIHMSEPTTAHAS